MAQVLSYSCPATESTTAVAADPAIPAAMLAPPEQRKIREKPGIKWKKRINTFITFGLAAGFVGYFLLDLIVFTLIPTRPANVIAEGTGLIGPYYAPTVKFTYSSFGFAHVRSQEVSRSFYDSVRPFGQLDVHVISLGPWCILELDRPWSDFINDRMWLLIACAVLSLLAGLTWFWRFRLLPRQFEIQNTYGKWGVPAVARIVRHNELEFGFPSIIVRKLTYRYIDPNGVSIDQQVDASVVREPKHISAPLIVLYLPTDPKSHRVYSTLPFTVELA